jgi:hypothetical protein
MIAILINNDPAIVIENIHPRLDNTIISKSNWFYSSDALYRIAHTRKRENSSLSALLQCMTPLYGFYPSDSKAIQEIMYLITI